MTKFTVQVPLVSYYEIEIEAENPSEALLKIGEFVASDVSAGEYQGWDIDYSNISFQGLVETA